MLMRFVSSALAVVLLAVGALVIADAIYVERHTPAKPLTEVYTPTFRHLPPTEPLRPTIAALRHDLLTPTGRQLLERTVPSESGVLWLALIVALVIGFDFEHPGNPRNLDLLLMQVLGF